MKIWIWASLTLLMSCSKTEEPCGKPDLSCITAKIDEFKKTEGALAVYRYEVDCDYHYWFHDGSLAWDGAEYIYNTECEEVCYFCGECVQAACAEKYPGNPEDWTLVWKK